ncbi:putative nucleotidyltransferase, Ribonuclease H [Helianthus annuus]|uniref:Nucleotidyltransferase, Ribonuclease H n=1 Tax=Helianthus annuus TaxID=4232 RepID=A0A9K3HRZ9_HELAN|nr:putative nucleotidyltransferase, Ribonuclease H [Helianthus annuus]
MKQQEQSSKQQEEILKHVRDKSVNSSGSSFGSSGGDAEGRNSKPFRIGKIEFPKFSGEDVEGWVYRCEHFFAMDDTPPDSKLRCAAVHLEGDALQWHRAFMKTRNATVAEVPWDEYVRSISARFSDALFEDPLEEMASLTQTGSLQELNTAFDSLLNKVTLSETQAVSLYIKALKPEIRGPVKMFKPRTLHEAYSLAKTQALNNETWEEKWVGSKGGGSFSKSSNNKITPPTNAAKLPLLPTPNNNRTTTGSYKPSNNQRRLSSKELEQKRAKGECFWCTEKFVPGHKCATPRKQIYIIEADDEGDQAETEAESDKEEEEDHQISIHALTGMPSYSTMRVNGSMGTRQLYILIDSGSTHNFLKEKLAKKLECDSLSIPPVTVGVADGKKLTSTRVCKDFQWNMQGNWFKTEVLLLPLESYDMILGVQWLLPLNDILWNFQKMTMKFELEGKRYELKGLQNNLFAVCSLEKMGKYVRTGDSQFFSLQLTGGERDNTYHSRVVNVPVDETEAGQWKRLVARFPRVFEVPTGLPPQRRFDHKIVLKEGTAPISVRPYRYPAVQKDVIEKTTRELLDSGVIRDSQSAFAAPVVLVKKKDGQWRMCMDYRRLNEATVKDKFPIPLIDELLDELAGATFFSKLDLRSGYHQVRMAEEDIPKTAFRTHEGHYEFLVMPFGLTNAPATFQALMNHIFKPMLRKGVLVFFDDILVYSRSEEDHWVHLEKVLTIMQANRLFAKESKCVFGGRAIEYLGHVIAREGVSTDPKKIEAVQQWPVPKTVKQLRGFLGLAGYYRRFIRSFGMIARPLTDRLKKDAFNWGPDAQDAFERLKSALTSAPVLTLPDPTQPFVIEADASAGGVGAVLMQNRHPVSFLSKALSPRQNALSVYEKELLAIMLAVKQWHYYLITGPFVIRTDQKSLKHLLSQKVTTPLQHKWLAKLMGYDYSIEYKKGRDNVAADALSRVQGSELFVTAVSQLEPLLLDRIVASQRDDVDLQQLVTRVKEGVGHTKYKWNGRWLARDNRIVVGNDSGLREDMVKLCHESPIGGHSGVRATVQRVKGLFHWRGINKVVRRVVRKCDVCMRAKTENTAPAGLLQPLPVPEMIFSDISMDFIGGLPRVKGKDTVFVVVDRLTKYGHFMLLGHPYSARDVAQVFFDNVYKLHGCPNSIVSDRDPIFLSSFWKEFLHLQGIEARLSTAYHPQSDGQTEVVNRCLEGYLRCMVMERPHSWVKWVTTAEWWYNTTFHSSLERSPFEALYGYPPPLHIPYVPKDAVDGEVDEVMRDREAAVKVLRQSLLKAQNRMKQQADKKRSEREFEAGQWVYLKLQPYMQNSLRVHKHSKLTPKYFGPFLIIEKVGSVAYKLDLPEEAHIHPVFHVSLLKEADGPPEKVVPIPLEARFNFQPQAVLDRKLVKRGHRAAMKFLSSSTLSKPYLDFKIQTTFFLFHGSLSRGFWLSVLLVSRVSESTFQQSWLGFRPNSAHTGKSGAKDFMFGCLNFVFVSGMRPSLCSFTHFRRVLPPETFPLAGNFSSPPYDILNTILQVER